jgi:Xaa-Pro aminopeptidase
MIPDKLRLERIGHALRQSDLQAFICALPSNVLLLSGYWPVVGTTLALATREGRTLVLAPEDERELAEAGWADEVRTFEPGSLAVIRTASAAVCAPLRAASHDLGIERGRIGFEGEAAFEPASYVSCHLYGSGMADLLSTALPGAALVSASALLRELRAVKTPREIERIRTACRIAGVAFQAGASRLQPGRRETEAAVLFQAALSTRGTGWQGVRRAYGHVAAMAGVNAAGAFGAYARSRSTRIQAGRMVLIHCNSTADGYWTDITRTYCLGPGDARQRELYDAVFAARAAALAAIRPGARAAAVDQAARRVLEEHGLGNEFKHPTGHGVGFAAIDHNARPCLHPKSEDVLEVGMVFNVEPAVYIDGWCGLRHCDMVAVTESGAELLTPFHDNPEALLLGEREVWTARSRRPEAGG